MSEAMFQCNFKIRKEEREYFRSLARIEERSVSSLIRASVLERAQQRYSMTPRARLLQVAADIIERYPRDAWKIEAFAAELTDDPRKA